MEENRVKVSDDITKMLTDIEELGAQFSGNIGKRLTKAIAARAAGKTTTLTKSLRKDIKSIVERDLDQDELEFSDLAQQI